MKIIGNLQSFIATAIHLYIFSMAASCATMAQVSSGERQVAAKPEDMY